MTGWVMITQVSVYIRTQTVRHKEWGDGEGEGSKTLSLLSYTLEYISLPDVDILEGQKLYLMCVYIF